MRFIQLSLPTLVENLAFDEALIHAADELELLRQPILRLWQSSEVGVVVGRSTKVAEEVFLDTAQQLNVSILRRPSGGATVVVGPGCLMYSLLIDLDADPRLRMLDAVHQFVMHGLIRAIESLVPNVQFNGTCDLTIDDRKFSGNSLKVGRSWTLYHGTLLLEMDLSLLDRLLKHPPREPEYRRGRPHSQFVANLHCDEQALSRSLRLAWQADETLDEASIDQLLSIMHKLIESRYGQAAWNFQR